MVAKKDSTALDEQSRKLARALNAHVRRDPPLHLRRKMWAELDRSIAADVEPMFALDKVDPWHAARPGPPRAFAWLGVSVAVVAVAAAAVLLAVQPKRVDSAQVSVTPAAAEHLSADTPLTHSAQLHSPAPQTAQGPTAAVDPPSEPNTTKPNTTKPRGVRRVNKASKAAAPTQTQPSSPRSGSNLHQEAAVLALARHALARGDHAAALRELEVHRRRFMHGLLTQEREVLRVRALCSSGARAKAARYIAAFHRDFPSSPHRVAVDTACAR